jgi:formylglycine-generating enzyme required for sulfatase activity
MKLPPLETRDPMPTDTADIRQYLTSAYNDEELSTLCSDYFRDVYDTFVSGMTKTQKIQLLLDHCQRRDLIPNLLAALERDRPEQYRKRFGQAVAEPSPAQPSAKRSPRQVFISHAHEDTDFAHRLAADLGARGWRVWIAPDSIWPGKKWAEAIDRGLDESDVFVLVLTPFAVNSGWVKTETYGAIELAHRGEMRFIPAEVVSCRPPTTWNAFQRIPFTGRYESGLAALLAVLGGAEAQPSTTGEAQRSPETVAHGAARVKEQSGKALPVKQEEAGVADQSSKSQPAVPRFSVLIVEDEPSRDLLTITTPIHLELVRVPAGEFLMGSDPKVDKAASAHEQPQHRLYLPHFYIGKYPVTNEQYAAFTLTTRQTVPLHWKNGRIPAGRRNHPVVNITWRDAVAFCRWLSEASGKTVRLPTEAEWEKAARGPEGWIYPWGNDPPTKELCNFGGNVGGTTSVGQYLAGASSCGALDMAGTVWEWTGSLWGTDPSKPEFGYPYNTKDGRENPSAPDGVWRVLRGGSFGSDVQGVRCACRYRNVSDYRSDSLGIRVVSPGF